MREKQQPESKTTIGEDMAANPISASDSCAFPRQHTAAWQDETWRVLVYGVRDERDRRFLSEWAAAVLEKSR